MNILVTVPINDRQKAKIEAESPADNYTYALKPDVTDTMLREADVILGNLQQPDQLHQTEHLKWIQLNNAGTEGYCVPGILPQDAILTNATGAYGLAISEHMIGGLFMLRKKLHTYYANQQECRWNSEGHVDVVEGNTVVVIGLGDIGSTFARKMKALGCRIIGIKRYMTDKPDWVDELYTMDALDRILPEADVVSLSLPGNTATYHTLNRNRIGLLKSNAVVINVGRGTAIDTEALCDALSAGTIRGAFLDVTDPEPLPADHPLWKMPGVLITPHVSGGYSLPETLEQIVGIMADNLERFVNGRTMRSVVDPETGYAVK